MGVDILDLIYIFYPSPGKNSKDTVKNLYSVRRFIGKEIQGLVD
jgi:hypothetical protein